MIGTDPGEFGIGSRHLHQCLQRLAIVEPRYTTETEPLDPALRILNEPDGVYRFVVRAEGVPDQPFEPSQKLEIIRF